MSKNKKELHSILYELSTQEERDKFATEKTFEILNKFNDLYESLNEALNKRDKEYGSAIELLITETDKQVKSYLSVLQKSFDNKVEQVNTLLNVLEDKVSETESDLRTQIREAKSAIKDFSSYKDRTVDLIDSIVKKSQESFENLEEKITKTTKEIDTIKKEFADKFGKVLSLYGGGAPHRRIQINGTTVATKYADINFIASNWSVSNNDTTGQTDITIGVSVQNPVSGAIDGSNTTFVFASAPSYLSIDDTNKFEDVDYTRSGTTIEITNGSPPVNSIKGIS